MSEQTWNDTPLPLDGEAWGDAPTAESTWGPAPVQRDPWDVPPAAPTPDPVALASSVSSEFAEATGSALAFYRHPDEVSRLSGELARQLTDLVQSAYREVRERRVIGRVTQEVVAAELQVLADAATTLDALGKTLSAAAKLARDTAGEVLLEVRPDDEQRTATVHAADGHGGKLKVTRTQATEVSAKPEEIVDVLVPWLLAREDAASAFDPGQDLAYADGARQGIDAWRELVGPPKWKSTALDALGRKMDDAGEHALAIRLGHAHGRVAKGEARTTIDRVTEA